MLTMQGWITTVAGLLLIAPMTLAIAVLLALAPVILLTAVRVYLRGEAIPFSYAWRSLLKRRRSTLTTFTGFTLVVFVISVMMMLAQGIEQTLTSVGGDRNVKIVRRNQPNEWTSTIEIDEMQAISALKEIARNSSGGPMISKDVVFLTWLPKVRSVDSEDGANIMLRGVSAEAFQLHAPRAVRGRRFGAAAGEVVLGKGLEDRFQGATLGGTLTFADRQWRVVGVADHGGSAYDSEIWTDVELLRASLQRQGRFSSATLQLAEGATLQELQAKLAQTEKLSDFTASRETDYWGALSKNYVDFVTLLGSALGFIFAFAAVLGAMNTMYAQVAMRTRELGTLRAVGFKRRAVLVAVVTEAVLQSLIAGVLGIALASTLHRFPIDITTMETLSEIRYTLRMNPVVVSLSLLFSLLLGYAGGLMPALRAYSIPIVSAVRAE